MIFQEPMTSLNPVFSCGRQVVEAIELHQKIRGRAAWSLAEEMFARVGIPDPGHRVREYPHQMSGGMRQRVMIAMALSCNPSLLIADEPTTALDMTIQAQILDLLGKLQAETGMSILLITHDLGIVARTAHDVCVMYAGRVVERAPLRGLFDGPLHPYTRGLLRCVPRLSQRKRRLEVIDDSVHAYCARPAALEEAAPGHWVARPTGQVGAEPSEAAEGVLR
jgi:ABC-type dipeptide/oligopeptide/nickel transport system ATPase component